MELRREYQGHILPEIQPKPSDIFIAVMGMTGVGKSTFISHCTDQEVKVSAPGNLKSCTQEVHVYRCKFLEPTATVYLVDTPGFDDTERTDSDILKEIANWLTVTYEQNIRLRGILYLHRISDVRMGGCARKNLAMFKKLCGPTGLRNVFFVSTFWEKVDLSVGESTEDMLKSEDQFWGFFVSKGAGVHRHYNTQESAFKTISIFAPGSTEVPPGEAKMAIQTEMVDAKKNLDQTAAGQELQNEFEKERRKLMDEMREREKEMEEARQARDKEVLDILREEQENQRQQLKRRDKEMQELKVSLEMMHEEKIRELEDRLRKNEEQKREYQNTIDSMKQTHLAEIAELRQEQQEKMDVLNRKLEEMALASNSQRRTEPKKRMDDDDDDAEDVVREYPQPKEIIDWSKVQMDLRVAQQYRLNRKIYARGSGDEYLAAHVISGELVTVKLEPVNTKPSLLSYEARVMKSLKGGVGIPNIHWYGTEEDYNAMVYDVLGPSIEELFDYCNRKYSLKTILMLADQMISRIEYMHSMDFIHRNLEFHTFMMGIGKRSNQVNIVSFDLAKRYRDYKTRLHIPYRENKSPMGHHRFMPINTHLGVEPSRRDDMESLGYLLLYFLRGSLPWQGLKDSGSKGKRNRVMEKKLTTPTEVLCRGYPNEFAIYLNYTRSLRFEDEPDYSYLRKVFRDLFNRKGYKYDYEFDWVQKKRPE